MGRLECDGTSILDYYTDNDDCRDYTLFYLRAAHLVLILSYGDTLFMGNAPQRQTAPRLSAYQYRRKLHH